MLVGKWADPIWECSFVAKDSRRSWLRNTFDGLVARSSKVRDNGEGSAPFSVRPCLLSDAEHEFSGMLSEALPNLYVVHPKVRMADIVHVERATQFMDDATRLSRISIDFVICDHVTQRPLALIKLYRTSGVKGDYRDKFLDRVSRTAGLPLIYFSGDGITREDINQGLAPILNRVNAPKLKTGVTAK